MNFLIFTLLAVVAAVSALIAIHAAHKCSEQSNEATRLVTALSRERGSIAALESQFASLGAAFGKLSGRVAAIKRWDQDNHGEETTSRTSSVDRMTDSPRSGAPSALSDASQKAAWKAMMREKLLVKPTR
jgi:hypothetical protein